MAIVTTIEGSIAKISIDRPEKRNTLDTEMCRELSRQLIDLREDNRIRVIMLTGQNNVFCAGLDIEAQVKGDKELFESFRRVIDALDACTKPIVTAVCGPAVAEGAALLYHCDLVFCGRTRNVLTSLASSGLRLRSTAQPLAVKMRRYKLAAQKLLLSEPISAAEAVAMGIVNHIVSDEKVTAAADAAAARLASLPPIALKATKRLLKAAYLSGLSEQRKLETEIADQLKGNAETIEAFNAFLEKRSPKFED